VSSSLHAGHLPVGVRYRYAKLMLHSVADGLNRGTPVPRLLERFFVFFHLAHYSPGVELSKRSVRSMGTTACRLFTLLKGAKLRDGELDLGLGFDFAGWFFPFAGCCCC
jgi:hypothetical protein